MIPKCGRVVVIDNNPDEVMPLLHVLSKEGVAFTYFSGDPDQLPSKPLSSVRIIFLDLELVGVAEDKTIVSEHQNRLVKILSNNNGPYILIKWSIREGSYPQTIWDKIFDSPELKNIKPFHMIDVQKADYFDSETVNDATGTRMTYKPKNGFMQSLQSKIIDELKARPIFMLYLAWEEMVQQSAGKNINEFSMLFENDSNWQDNMSILTRSLAVADAGQQLSPTDMPSLVRHSFAVFNHILMDNLEKDLTDSALTESWVNISDPDIQLTDEIIGKINSKLLISKNQASIRPGCVFGLKKDQTEIFQKAAMHEYLDMEKIMLEFSAKIDKPPSEISENPYKIKEAYKDEFQQFKQKIMDVIESTMTPILMEVSPLCDYAQKKWKLHRAIRGMLIDAKYLNFLKKETGFLYKTPTLEYNGMVVIAIFDLRYLKTQEFETFNPAETPILFCVRDSILIDLQSHLGRHVNRPGVTSVNRKQK